MSVTVHKKVTITFAGVTGTLKRITEFPEFARSDIETTKETDTAKTFVPGYFVDYGAIAGEWEFAPSGNHLGDISGSSGTMTVHWGNEAGNYYWQFTAYCNRFQVQGAIGEQLVASVRFKITGAVTKVDGSGSGSGSGA